MEVDDALFDIWNDDEAKIAQLELCIVLMSLAQMGPHLRGFPGIWWVDNIAALMSLIRGRSNVGELDAMSGLIHVILCALQCPIYFEWVASGDNWSDGVSRQGLKDEWMMRHGFHTTCFKPYLWMLKLPISIVGNIFTFV
eukprot:Skav210323  [mRNA]  locus=scaffold475:321714:322133:- [translate_table: standard]